MSDDVDKEDQTEDATEKKLNDAIEHGVVPNSPEASLLATLAGMLVIAVFILPGCVDRLVAMLVYFIDDPSGWTIDGGNDAAALFNLVAGNLALNLAPVILLLTLVGLTASMAQNGLRIVPTRIFPDYSRISIREGFSRVFGLNGATTFLKNLLKLVAVIGIAIMLLNSQKIGIMNSVVSDISDLPYRILNIGVRLLSGLVVATLLVTSADLVWARIRWRRGQRMSRREIKDELKESQGDPLLKARLRSIRMDRARKRMLTSVPKATMVVVNPTHYAVALRYVRSEGGTPIVVAKGLDLVALKIREIAEQHAIPVIEDKPLARSLYDAVKVDKAIPQEFYRAVAELIHLIYKKKSSWPLVRDRSAL
jgi:flagellar biosynthesis protein FlhB